MSSEHNKKEAISLVENIKKKQKKSFSYFVTKDDLKLKRKKYKYFLIFPVFVFAWLYLLIKRLLAPPILKKGIHAITGITGGSKTLMAHKLSQYYNKKGIQVISNSKFNDIVKVVDITEHYNDYEVIKPINLGGKPTVLVLDEINKQFNRRMNKRNDYNGVFIPLIDDLLTHRHNNVIAIYFLGQSWDLLDGQLQAVIQHVNMVNKKMGADLDLWLKRDSFRVLIRPKKIEYFHMSARSITKNDTEKYIQSKYNKIQEKKVRRGKIKYKPIKKYIVTINHNDLATFDTFAFKRKKIEKPEVSK